MKPFYCRDYDDNSPLHMAVIHGYTRSIRSILNVHANLLDAPNQYGVRRIYIVKIINRAPEADLEGGVHPPLKFVKAYVIQR